MNDSVLIDTGPLVAYLVDSELNHDWVVEQAQRYKPPFVTSESVLSEALFLLNREKLDSDLLLKMVEGGGLRLPFSVEAEIADIRALMRRYRSLPMSLADASLVRLSELIADSKVMTFDSHFRIYRRHGNRVIPVLMP